MSEPLLLAYIAAMGLVMGSAITAIAYRIPRDKSWVHGRSACPSCGHTLGFFDLIPVFSWAFSRGRFRHCKASIPPRYPITELLCMAWALLLYRHLGLGWDFPLLAIWGFLMIALIWIDLDFQLLPDAITFPGTLIAVAAVLQWPGGARHALLGVLVGSGLLWALAWGYFKLRKIEGMGGGDIKLAAMFGVPLGWKLTLLTLFLASLVGSLWGAYLMMRGKGHWRTPIPFGTLLAPAALIAFLWGERWMEAYLRLLRP